jgi:hypothetical protein
MPNADGRREHPRRRNCGSPTSENSENANFGGRRACEVRRIPLPRTLVNRGKNEGRSPTLQPSSYSVSTLGDIIDDSLDHGRGALGVHSS